MEECGHTPFLRWRCISSCRMMMMILWKSMREGGNKENKWQQKVTGDINQGHRKDGAIRFLLWGQGNPGYGQSSECLGSLAPQGCPQLRDRLSCPEAQVQLDTLYQTSHRAAAPAVTSPCQHSLLPALQEVIPYGEGLKGSYDEMGVGLFSHITSDRTHRQRTLVVPEEFWIRY